MTDGEPETVVSASLQKIKSIKNPVKLNLFYFIKSETSDSFVNHFDGHFAYLKTLDFNIYIYMYNFVCCQAHHFRAFISNKMLPSITIIAFTHAQNP